MDADTPRAAEQVAEHSAEPLLRPYRPGADSIPEITRLIRFYQRLGYTIVGAMDWDSTNYVSVIMAKSLTTDGGSGLRRRTGC